MRTILFGDVQSEVTGLVTHGCYFMCDDDDIAITNPYMSECTRFSVDPTKYYGLSQEQVALVTEYNEARCVSYCEGVTEDNMLDIATRYIRHISSHLSDATKDYCNKWLQAPYCIEEFRNELILNGFHDVEHLCDSLQYLMDDCHGE